MLKVLLFYLSCLPSTVTALIKNSGRNISFFVKSQIPQISVFSKINEWEMSFDLTFYTKTMSTPKSEKFWRKGEKGKKSARTHSTRTERFRNFFPCKWRTVFLRPSMAWVVYDRRLPEQTLRWRNPRAERGDYAKPDTRKKDKEEKSSEGHPHFTCWPYQKGWAVSLCLQPFQ